MVLFFMLLILFILIVVVSTLNFIQFNKCLDICKKSIAQPLPILATNITKYDLDLLNRILGDGKKEEGGKERK